MIFQHTIGNVLNGIKTQTSRVAKPSYHFDGDISDIQAVYTSNGSRRMLYSINQALAVQLARGQKGIARIRITHLSYRDVKQFTDADIEREGFITRAEFDAVWDIMHPKTSNALVIRFELVLP